MILQLNPPLPVVTVKGDGIAHLVIDYGPESHLLWVVFLDSTGECWSVPGYDLRLRSNWSMNAEREGGDGL